MTGPIRRTLVFTTALLLSVAAAGQVRMSGIVVDSLSLEPLPFTTFYLKKSKTGTNADVKGRFSITAPAPDTVIISHVGYKTVAIAMFFDEDDFLIMLPEEVRTLQEVVVDVFPEKKINTTPPAMIRTLDWSGAIQSPFTYFSKTEKDKRKVNRYREEQFKMQTYIALITDPAFQRELTNKYDISDSLYYEIVAEFNKANTGVRYLTDEDEIRQRLENFFVAQLTRRRRETD